MIVFSTFTLFAHTAEKQENRRPSPVRQEKFRKDCRRCNMSTYRIMSIHYCLPIAWDLCVLSRWSRINKSSKISSRRTSSLMDADRSTLSFDPEALDRLSDRNLPIKKIQPQANRWAMQKSAWNFNSGAKILILTTKHRFSYPEGYCLC